jgi:hypothetical protein
VSLPQNLCIIRSEREEKQIAATQKGNAKSVPNMKADLDRSPGCGKAGKNAVPLACAAAAVSWCGRLSGLSGLERVSAWQIGETGGASRCRRLWAGIDFLYCGELGSEWSRHAFHPARSCHCH